MRAQEMLQRPQLGSKFKCYHHNIEPHENQNRIAAKENAKDPCKVGRDIREATSKTKSSHCTKNEVFH